MPVHDLHVGEHIGFADAGFLDVVVAAVGPHRIDDRVVGGEAAVVADERTRGEEADDRDSTSSVLILRFLQVTPSSFDQAWNVPMSWLLGS